MLNNYRPISLLPIFSKILEKVIYQRLFNFLNTNNALFSSQYGFRKNHSTINAITELVSHGKSGGFQIPGLNCTK